MALGLVLRGAATAAIDVSDVLLGDLGHILEASGVGACVDTDAATNLIAAHPYFKRAKGQFDLKISPDQWRSLALAGGDDYELIFTAPPAQRAAVAQAGQSSQTPVTRIGQIRAELGVLLLDGQGQTLPNRYASFDHFA